MVDTLLHTFGLCGDNAMHPDFLDLLGQFGYLLQELQISYQIFRKNEV